MTTRSLNMPEPAVHFFRTADDTELRLIRYQGGNKGPVMLAPGFGTSTLAFSTTTVEVNLPEFLFARDYDVWLFDYRSSPELASSSTQYTIDDVITDDWPAAVNKVLEISGSADVQIMGHCVGSVTALAAVMTGLQNVRSIVSSQFTPYVHFSTKTELKAGTHLPSLLNVIGVEGLNPDCEEDNWEHRVVDDLLRFYPTWERCDLDTCHRILFLYGEVFKHQQLNDQTHLEVHKMFGNATMSAFKHLSEIIRRRRIVDHNGADCYLPLLGELKLPIAFLHGAENRFIMPSGSEKTFETLKKLNDPAYYIRHVIPNYAHMDCFIGNNAHRDVFPIVAAELDKYN